MGLPFLDDGLHRRNKPVAASWESLDEARVLSRLVQRFAQLPDGAVQPCIEIDERVGTPQPFAKFLTRHDVAGTIEQQTEDLEGLISETNLQAVSAQLTRCCVQLED